MYLDHVVLAVHDLESATSELAHALALTVLPGGEHPGRGTHNAIVRFGQSYLELIAVNNAEEARARPGGDALLAALGHGPGWLGYALGVNDLDATVADLRARGLKPGSPDPGHRLRPDGVDLQWRTAHLDERVWGGTLPFLIQHDTPLEIRAGAAGASQHALGVTAVSAVAIAVRDLALHVPTYSAVLGREPDYDDVAFVRARRANWRLDDGCIVRLLAPTAPGAVAEHLQERGEGVFIVRLGVADLQAAMATLRAGGTDVSEPQADGTVFLTDPRQSLGARFALVQMPGSSAGSTVPA